MHARGGDQEDELDVSRRRDLIRHRPAGGAIATRVVLIGYQVAVRVLSTEYTVRTLDAS